MSQPNLHSANAAAAGPSGQRQPQVFEFTKRKRWAEILITELPETLTLLLSPTTKILYCAPAVSELLGWAVEDLVDATLLDFVNGEDQLTFREKYQESLQRQDELFIYTRFKCKPEYSSNTSHPAVQKELLFEIRGKPYYIPEDPQCKLFALMAKLYPSRNTALFNTFLELKLDKERLTKKLADLRSRNAQTVVGSMGPPMSVPMSMSSHHGQYPSAGYGIPGSRLDDLSPSPAYDIRGGMTTYGHGSYGNLSLCVEDEDDLMRKKKLKKSNSTENQHVCVTCGRTDSPEWRKGPLGPKTLCNACGLRWSKKSRKHDDGVQASPVSNTGPSITHTQALSQSMPEQPQWSTQERMVGDLSGYRF